MADVLGTPSILQKWQESSHQQDVCRETILKLNEDGHGFVANVAVATKNREKVRRLHEKADAKRIKEYVTQDKENCEDVFGKVLSKWEDVSNIKNIQLLQKLLLSQRNECNEVLKGKDALIERLTEELNETRMAAEQKRSNMEEESQRMSQRIDAVIAKLCENSKTELKLITNAIHEFGQELSKIALESSASRLETKEQNNKMYDEAREELWRTTKELQRNLVVERDKVALLKIQLGDDIHRFQILLRKMEASQFLNMDKMFYGIQVIKKQLRESRILSSEMKRSHVRYVDLQFALKAKLRLINEQADTDHRKEVINLDRTTKTLHAALRTARLLHESHLKTFESLFNMRGSEVRRILTYMSNTGCFVNTVLLGEPWQMPDLSFLDEKPKMVHTREGRLLERLEEFMLPIATTSEEESDGRPLGGSSSCASLRLKRPLDTEKLLHFICDELEFMIDKQVWQIAKMVFPDARTFIVSNSLFNAMGVKTSQDLNIFMAYMLHHSTSINKDEVLVTRKDILLALEDYINSQKSKISDSEEFDMQPVTDARSSSSFWKQCTMLFNPNLSQIWDAVIFGLQHFVSEMLKCKRFRTAKLDLKKQIAQLKKLLDQ